MARILLWAFLFGDVQVLLLLDFTVAFVVVIIEDGAKLALKPVPVLDDVLLNVFSDQRPLLEEVESLLEHREDAHHHSKQQQNLVHQIQLRSWDFNQICTQLLLLSFCKQFLLNIEFENGICLSNADQSFLSQQLVRNLHFSSPLQTHKAPLATAVGDLWTNFIAKQPWLFQSVLHLPLNSWLPPLNCWLPRQYKFLLDEVE